MPVGRRELSLEISHYFGEHVRAFGKEEITNTSVAKFFSCEDDEHQEGGGTD